MILDFIFALVLILCIFFGYKKGFSQMLISCLVFLFSLILVVSLYNYLGDVFFASEYGSGLLNKVAEGIASKIDTLESGLLGNIPFLAALLGRESNTADLAMILAQKALKTALAIPLIIVAYIILRFVVFFVRRIVKFTMQLPIIGFFDSILGAVCGFLTGLIALALIYFAVGYIQLIPGLEFLREQYDTSFVVVLINDFLR